MNFAVHDAAGNILRTGQCPEQDLALQAGAGETAVRVEGVISDVAHKIINGGVVKRPQAAVPVTVQRRQAYPQMTEYVDAQVKKSSSDPAVQAAGIAQEAKYFADCLAVKSKIPKEESL